MYPNLEPPPPTSPLPVLPMDIIVDIFCRIPVKTLIRFKCLSKQFLSLINSPDFINYHLQFSSLNPKFIFFEQQTSLQFHLLNINTLDKAYDVDIPFADLDISDAWFIEMIGSCDGLLALSNRDTGTIILCNISTRKLKILPFCWYDYVESLNLISYGFGRGVCFDDYKLVRVTSSRGRQEASLSVYSLKTESWRKIDDFPCYLVFTEMAAFFKGTLNWLCWESSEEGCYKGYCSILSFDLTKFFS